MPHVQQTTWAGISADITAAVAALRDDGVERVATIGFCMGGRMSFLAATLGLDLAGVIGLYGTLVGPWRNDAPEPVAQATAGRIASPGPRPVRRRRWGHHARTHVAAFEAALATAGVEHRIVTYEGAPHSFFDRKAAEFADASAAAWDEISRFVDAI